MTVQQLVNRVNLETDELLDSDEENIQYINYAITLLSQFLASMADAEVMDMVNVKENAPIPERFISLIPPNGYPIYAMSNKWHLLNPDDYEIKNVRYTYAKAPVSSLHDNVPFDDIFADVLTLIASFAIKKKIMMPMESCQQDKAFVEEVMAAIKAAKGGV